MVPIRAPGSPSTRPQAIASFTSPPPIPPLTAAARKNSAGISPSRHSGLTCIRERAAILPLTQSGISRRFKSTREAASSRKRNRTPCTLHLQAGLFPRLFLCFWLGSTCLLGHRLFQRLLIG